MRGFPQHRAAASLSRGFIEAKLRGPGDDEDEDGDED